MKKCVIAAAAVLCVLFWAGCETFGHDCQKNPDCTPICVRDLAQMAKNPEQAKKNWERFKAWNIQYVPQKGCPILNSIGFKLEKLAKQFKYQVVIPYKELDEQGLISTYKYFCEDVNVLVKSGRQQNEAINTVYEIWFKKYGKEQCDKLFAAIPLIRQMQRDKQCQQALRTLLPQMGPLLILSIGDKNFRKRFGQEFVREIQAPQGWFALSNYVLMCTEVGFGITYVREVDSKNAKELADIEAALNQCKSKFL